MSSLQRNIVANLVGKFWSVAIVLILIPQYIHYLGIESYGLIGFYSTLIGSMAILDLGLSTTLNRELARFRAESRPANDTRNLTFSLECVYWGIGLLISLIVVSLSGPIAENWVNAEKLPSHVVRESVILMGIVIAFQWPISLYSGGLTGLEKQVLNNTINVIMSTLRAAGVLIVLIFFSRTLQAFFLWQAGVSLLYVLVMRWALWKEMPRHHQRPRFSREQLKIIWRFAAGMTAIGVVTFLLMQVDKIILSKLLSLSHFGYYTLGFSIATSISMLTNPVSIAFFPRFTTLIYGNKQEELKLLYHQACKLMASFIFPFCIVLFFFMHDILRIWTKDITTTEQTCDIARILLAGSMLNALMVMPYNLLIANGWTRFTIIQNSIAAILLIPLLFWLANKYGGVGAAYVWVLVNLGYVLISQPLMHRKLLKKELFRWYWNDTLIPLLPPLLTVLAIKFSLEKFLPDFKLNLWAIGAIFLVAFSITLFYMREGRVFLLQLFQKKSS